MSKLTASDLKSHGAAAIETALAKHSAVLVTVHGHDRFAAMDIADYRQLCECDLDAAIAQSHDDLAAGRAVVESAQAHMARLNALLVADSFAKVRSRAHRKA